VHRLVDMTGCKALEKFLLLFVSNTVIGSDTPKGATKYDLPYHVKSGHQSFSSLLV